MLHAAILPLAHCVFQSMTIFVVLRRSSHHCLVGMGVANSRVCVRYGRAIESSCGPEPVICLGCGITHKTGALTGE